jgi:hypothetical protein
VTRTVRLAPPVPTTDTRTAWPGRSPASTSASDAGSGVAVPSTAVTSSPAWIPALAAGPPATTLLTSSPPLVVAATSTPSQARWELVTLPWPISWGAMSRTVLAGMAKPIPGAALPPSWGSVAARVGMPMTRPWRSTRAPPELPGLMGALVWMTLGRATPLSSFTVRPRALTIPSVTLDCRPSGLPMARVTSPTCRRVESAKLAGCSPPAARCSTARSSAGKLPTSRAGYWWPSARVTWKLLAPWTTWALVTTSPPASKTMPEPRPWLVWIRTTEGPTCWTTWTNCCWRARADGATCAAGVAADELVALAVVAEQPARTSSATSAATAGRSRRGPPPRPGRGLRMRSRIILVPFLR